MKRNRLATLIIVTILLSFTVCFTISEFKHKDNVFIMDSNLVAFYKINKDDIEQLSSPKQFSGKIMYLTELPEDKDIVPNETIAVKLGMILLESYYGKQVYEEKPYHVALFDSVWVVETSLNPPLLKIDSSEIDSDRDFVPLICGGVGHVEISKHSGKIYTIYHTK